MDDELIDDDEVTIVDGPVYGGPLPSPILIDCRGPISTPDGDRALVLAPRLVGKVVLHAGLNVVRREDWAAVEPRLTRLIESGDIVVLGSMPRRKHERVDLAGRSRGALGIAAIMAAEDSRAVVRFDVASSLRIAGAHPHVAPSQRELLKAIAERIAERSSHEYGGLFDCALTQRDRPPIAYNAEADSALALIRSALA